jgi:hypothetical protein
MYTPRFSPVGTVSIRTRHKRGGVKRAWVKVAEPNVWKLRAVVVWEAKNGPLPKGQGVHHEDENTLNDDIDNLQAVTKGQHLAIHRPASNSKRIARFVAARRARRWSTKSKTKRTGRPPQCDQAALSAAVADMRAGMNANAAWLKHGVPRTTLYRLAKK